MLSSLTCSIFTGASWSLAQRRGICVHRGPLPFPHSLQFSFPFPVLPSATLWGLCWQHPHFLAWLDVQVQETSEVRMKIRDIACKPSPQAQPSGLPLAPLPTAGLCPPPNPQSCRDSRSRAPNWPKPGEAAARDEKHFSHLILPLLTPPTIPARTPGGWSFHTT